MVTCDGASSPFQSRPALHDACCMTEALFDACCMLHDAHRCHVQRWPAAAAAYLVREAQLLKFVAVWEVHKALAPELKAQLVLLKHTLFLQHGEQHAKCTTVCT